DCWWQAIQPERVKNVGPHDCKSTRLFSAAALICAGSAGAACAWAEAALLGAAVGSSSSTTDDRPCFIARLTGVSPLAPFAFASAPLSSRSRTQSALM